MYIGGGWGVGRRGQKWRVLGMGSQMKGIDESIGLQPQGPRGSVQRTHKDAYNRKCQL